MTDTVDMLPSLAAEWSIENERPAQSVTVGSRYRAKWKCGHCSHRWQAIVKNRTLRHSRCPACSKADRSRPRGPQRGAIAGRAAAFIQRSISAHGERYDYSLVDYQCGTKKVMIICREHGAFEQSPADHGRGRGCDKCQRVESQEFIERAKAVHGDRYDYGQVVYAGMKSRKVNITCRIHGPFSQLPVAHLAYGCPACSESHGERAVRCWLLTNGVAFQSQYSFPDAEVRRLRFDFAVLGNQVAVIEYHGEQHYRPVSFGGTKTDSHHLFTKSQERDARKVAYCRANKIPLLVIPHWDYSRIDSILSEWMTTARMGGASTCHTALPGGGRIVHYIAA